MSNFAFVFLFILLLSFLLVFLSVWRDEREPLKPSNHKSMIILISCDFTKSSHILASLAEIIRFISANFLVFLALGCRRTENSHVRCGKHTGIVQTSFNAHHFPSSFCSLVLFICEPRGNGRRLDNNKFNPF